MPDSESNASSSTAAPMSEADRKIVDLFVDGVRVIGLPKSIGEIYGLLFISREPLSLDDLVIRLGISKGSASQGLRMLRGLGAVKASDGNGGRRTYYEPEISLKRLVGGFIREQVVPHLKSGRSKLKELEAVVGEISDPAEREFLRDRADRLDAWFQRGGVVLPLLQKILGE
jgi:DNA-binding transcriptional regulator GbsR (MarR family)